MVQAHSHYYAANTFHNSMDKHMEIWSITIVCNPLPVYGMDLLSSKRHY